MKKSLLLASVAMLATSAFAATDGVTYENKIGLKCESQWIFSTNYNPDGLAARADLNTNKCRTACIYNGVVYVGNSTNYDDTVVDGEGAKVDCCGIDKYDAKTGAFIDKIKVTLDGAVVNGLLCANQVGFDNFGNLYVAGYVGSNTYGYHIYVVDQATGAATKTDLTMTNAGRIDYCDVVGDITRKEAGCVIMAAAASPATDLTVYRWAAEKDGDFVGGWDTDLDIDSKVMNEAYPATQTAWGTAPMVRIVLGEGDTKYDAELFYVDGFNTYPALYNTTGAIIDSFANAVDNAPKSAGTNGVNEIQICGHNLIAYSNNQHTGDQGGNELEVCELGDGMAFGGMTNLWQLPQGGLGMTSDTGTRIHCIGKEYVTDANGKEGCLLLTFKTMNGMGVYLIADQDFQATGVEANVANEAAANIAVNGGVIAVSAEASSIAVYNVAGQLVNEVKNATEIAAPAAGSYIVKAIVAGTPVIKKVVL